MASVPVSRLGAQLFSLAILESDRSRMGNLEGLILSWVHSCFFPLGVAFKSIGNDQISLDGS